MTCTACGFANPHGMKFCGQCGEALRAQTTCAACGLENPPGFKFCGECGATLKVTCSLECMPTNWLQNVKRMPVRFKPAPKE
jgi:hypothetical protein